MPVVHFNRSKRLLLPAEFQAVFSAARYKISHSHFLILATDNQRQHSRLGLVVGKKNIRRAVDRNRVKRVVRDTFRHQQPHLGSLDIIFLARRGFDTLQPLQQTCIMQKTWQQLAAKVAKS